MKLCPGSILLAKSCQQIFFAIVTKEIFEKKCQKITYKYRKNNKSNKNQDLEKKRSQEGPRNVRKYRKNRKSNKDFSCQLKTPVTNIAKKKTTSDKDQDLETQKAKKDPEMSAKYRKNRKSSKDF